MAIIHHIPPFASVTEIPADSPRPPRQELFELIVFLSLIIPAMILSFFVVQKGGSFTLISIATILRDVSLVCLIAYFLWKNRESMRAVGWTAAHPLKEIAIGIVLFVPLLTATSMLESFLHTIGLSGPPTQLPVFLTPKGGSGIALAALLVVVVAITEETIFRGDLILRLQAITRSRAAAVFLSSVIFSIGHGYEGTSGVITVGALGLGLALVYLWRRSLVAPMVMHLLQDFIGIILVPLLAHK